MSATAEDTTAVVIDRKLERLLVATLGAGWQYRWISPVRPSVIATLFVDGREVGAFQVEYGRCWGPWTSDRKPIPEAVKAGLRAVRDALCSNTRGA